MNRTICLGNNPFTIIIPWKNDFLKRHFSFHFSSNIGVKKTLKKRSSNIKQKAVIIILQAIPSQARSHCGEVLVGEAGGWWLVHRCCCRAVRLHYKHINYTIVTHSWIKILSSLLRSIRCCVPVLCCMSRICLSHPLLACAMMEKEISKPLTV